VLNIINYPITGPVFSGPHESPFLCETTTFSFPDGTRPLGAPIDADCSIDTRVDYFLPIDSQYMEAVDRPQQLSRRPPHYDDERGPHRALHHPAANGNDESRDLPDDDAA
jgi:hypothetical protein